MLIKDSIFRKKTTKSEKHCVNSMMPPLLETEKYKSRFYHILDSCTNIVVNSFQGPLIEGSSVKTVKPGIITFVQMAEPNFLLCLKLLFAISSPQYIFLLLNNLFFPLFFSLQNW